MAIANKLFTLHAATHFFDKTVIREWFPQNQMGIQLFLKIFMVREHPCLSDNDDSA